ncbi:MAG: DUF6788 family protein [Terriglobia bacterium]
MAFDLDLARRGRLVRSLSALREMLPGSFVQRRRQCGKPTCRCADGQQLHDEFLLSVRFEGKPRTFHVPAQMAESVRQRVELRHRFRQIANRICELNLRRFLRQKEKS